MKRKNWIVIGSLVVGWIIFLGQPTAVSTKLRMIFVQLSTPFVKLGDYLPSVKSRRALDRQNRDLRSTNEVLRQQLRAAEEIAAENTRLVRLAGVREHAGFKTIAARVIGRDASNWWKSLQLDRGSNDGLRENFAVINADGLIGKIVKVTRGEARVLLLTDPSCKASALLQDTRWDGVVAGVAAAFASDPHLQMTYVKREAKLRAGETVITSGLGGIFPKGILIGTVTKARLNPQTGMYQDLDIKPAVDYRRVEEVLVIVE